MARAARTLKEYHAMKRQLQQYIGREINRFNSDTGMTVVALDLEYRPEIDLSQLPEDIVDIERPVTVRATIKL